MSLDFGAVFQDNCASSLSFSIFTQNDAGSGGGGAGVLSICSSIKICCLCSNALKVHVCLLSADFIMLPQTTTLPSLLVNKSSA